MLKGIPWQFIGPAAAAAVVILTVVFAFILKWQKATKPNPGPTNPPRTINDIPKKTLCFEHHGHIAENRKAVEMIGEQLKASQQQNSEQHGKIFDKLEDMGTTIIKEIHKKNG